MSGPGSVKQFAINIDRSLTGMQTAYIVSAKCFTGAGTTLLASFPHNSTTLYEKFPNSKTVPPTTKLPMPAGMTKKAAMPSKQIR